MSDQPALEEFLAGAEAFLESRYRRVASEERTRFKWGEGSDEVRVFQEPDPTKEAEALPRIRLAAEPDSEVFPYQAAGSIFRSYNLMLDRAAALDDLDRLAVTARRYEPRAENRTVYDTMHTQFLASFEALRPIFEALNP